jgi:hypothetical protein
MDLYNPDAALLADRAQSLVGVYPPRIARLMTAPGLLGARCTASPLRWPGALAFAATGGWRHGDSRGRPR